MRIVPFQPEHLQSLLLQPGQASVQGEIRSPAMARTIADTAEAYTALADDGQVIAVAGAFPQWEGRVKGWALLSHDAGRYMLRLTRAIRRWLDACPARRVEIDVDARWDCAVLWAHLLGFKHEGTMRAYAPDGSDAHLFARIRHG